MLPSPKPNANCQSQYTLDRTENKHEQSLPQADCPAACMVGPVRLHAPLLRSLVLHWQLWVELVEAGRLAGHQSVGPDDAALATICCQTVEFQTTPVGCSDSQLQFATGRNQYCSLMSTSTYSNNLTSSNLTQRVSHMKQVTEY